MFSLDSALDCHEVDPWVAVSPDRKRPFGLPFYAACERFDMPLMGVPFDAMALHRPGRTQ